MKLVSSPVRVEAAACPKKLDWDLCCDLEGDGQPRGRSEGLRWSGRLLEVTLTPSFATFILQMSAQLDPESESGYQTACSLFLRHAFIQWRIARASPCKYGAPAQIPTVRPDQKSPSPCPAAVKLSGQHETL